MKVIENQTVNRVSYKGETYHQSIGEPVNSGSVKNLV